MKRFCLLGVLLIAALVYGGCSYSTDYVIVNSSTGPVQVIYQIAESGIDPLQATGINMPRMLPTSELSGREWRSLSASEYIYDRSSRTVIVSLPAGHGLLVAQGGEGEPNASSAAYFIIKEIRVVGSNGELSVKGAAVQMAFEVAPRPFYRSGPPTLFTLTYR